MRWPTTNAIGRGANPRPMHANRQPSRFFPQFAGVLNMYAVDHSTGWPSPCTRGRTRQ